MNIAQALSFRGSADSYERQENIWLLEHFLNLSALEIKYKSDQELSVQQEQNFLAAIQRLEAGEPLAYITGSQPFWTLDLKVTKDTLVPRPDTEVLIETILNLSLQSNARIIDLGTGTGAIALSLASERPSWQVIATDVYLPTLDVAKENALKYGLTHVEFKLGSWFEALDENAQAIFDLIVSNPPYIDAEDPHMKKLVTEPKRALVADHQGLADLAMIIQQGREWLKPDGWMALEHGYDQAMAIQKMFSEHQFSEIRTVKDYGGNDRITLARKSI